MPKTQTQQLVVCVDNDDYGASLEKRKIYVALPDPAAEKHGLIRVIDESGGRLSLSKGPLSAHRFAAIRQESRAGCRLMPHPRSG
jgi:hypothetical protein